METYDSSIETQKHIDTVGKFINVIRKQLKNKVDLHEDTLVSYLILIAGCEPLKTSDKLLLQIKDNTKIITGNEIEVVDDILVDRALNHDKSKLLYPEKPEFDKWTPRLAGSTYLSDEYYMFLRELQVALKHHYACNRHHPEHYKNGIYGMNIYDVVEMFCDWLAGCKRHNNGSIDVSIKQNKDRFGYTDEVQKVFIKTLNMYFR